MFKRYWNRSILFVIATFISSCVSPIDVNQVRAGLIGQNVDVLTARLGPPNRVQRLESSNARLHLYRVRDPGNPCSQDERKYLGDLLCNYRALSSRCQLRAIVRSDSVIADVFLRDPEDETGPACQALFQRLGLSAPSAIK